MTFVRPIACSLSVGMIIITAIVGCSGGGAATGPGAGKARGTVSGTIKHKGQPIAENTGVTFLGGDGVAATGMTDATGHYSLKFEKSTGIPVGSYKVSFTPYNPGDSGTADPAQFFDKKTGMTKPPEVVKSKFDSKYTNPTTSGVTRDVNAGNNEINIDLLD